MPKTQDTETIFREDGNKVYGLALSITRNDKDAEDILQNTFLKIIKNLRNFRNESHLSTWIYRIAYNESLMALRRRKRQSRLTAYLENKPLKNGLGLFVNWSKLPDEQLLDKEIKERVDGAIKHMPIKYRMALLLNNTQGLLLKDAARILNLKTNSLKTRLHRARLMVREEIADYFKDQKVEEIKEDRRCNILIGFIYNYAEGNLGKNKELTFNRHIEDCLSCRSFLDRYVKAIRITKALECQDLPLELQLKIEQFIKRFLKKSKNAEISD